MISLNLKKKISTIFLDPNKKNKSFFSLIKMTEKKTFLKNILINFQGTLFDLNCRIEIRQSINMVHNLTLI